MRQCWNCQAAVSARDHFCGGCNAIQPPSPDRNYFEILEVSASYQLDEASLDQGYKRLSRLLHPDRFALATPRERRISLEHTTGLNDAYRTLRVPWKRGEYLLACWGVKVAGEGAGAVLPLETMEEVMELREKLMACAENPQARTQVIDGVRERTEQLLAQIGKDFSSLEAISTDQHPADRLEQLKQQFQLLRYFHGMLSDDGSERH